MVFSSESALCICWPKYYSLSFSISSSNECSGLIFFRIDWFDLAVQGTLKSIKTCSQTAKNFTKWSLFQIRATAGSISEITGQRKGQTKTILDGGVLVHLPTIYPESGLGVGSISRQGGVVSASPSRTLWVMTTSGASGWCYQDPPEPHSPAEPVATCGCRLLGMWLSLAGCLHALQV